MRKGRRGEKMAQKKNFCKIILAPSPCFSEDADMLISSLPFGENEKLRLSAIKNQEYKNNSLSALLCLHELLTLSDAAQNNLSICRTSNGKPYFASADLFFSISHAENTVAVALSDTPVGIDIEFIDDHRDFISLSRRFFAPDEHKAISESNSPTEDFFALWTKKEALAKITGEGLTAICRADGLDDSHSFSLFSLNDRGKNAYLSVCRERGDYTPNLSEDFLIKKRCDLYEIQN